MRMRQVSAAAMASGSGTNPVDHFQEPAPVPGHAQRQNSNATTTTTTCPSHGDGPPSAAAAECGGADAPSTEPLPAAPVDRPQEEQAGSGSRGTNGSSSPAAGAVDQKGEDADPHSPPRTAGSTPSTSYPHSAWLVGAGAVDCHQRFEQLVRVAEKKKPEQKQPKSWHSNPKKALWSKCKSLITRKKKTLPITEVGNHYRVTKDRPVLLNFDAYSRFRPVLGDGECFYRSFIYSYLEQVLDRQDTYEEQCHLDTIERVSTEHTNLECSFEFRRSYKNIEVNKLLKGRPLYIPQWLKSYCDALNDGIMNGNYNPADRRSKRCQERNHKGSNKSSKSLQAKGLSSANSADGAPTTEKVCISTATEEYYMEQIQQLSEKITDLKVSVYSTEEERDFYFSKLRDIELLCQRPELEYLPTWEVIRQPGESSEEMFGEGAGACVLGGAMDIFLVQPRDGGVPPSRFQTIRRAGWSYWTGALKMAMKLGTHNDVPRSWSWESVMGRPAYGGGGCVMKAIATCMRAQHCIAFERRYGAGTFKYQLSDLHMQYLIDACKAEGLIDPEGGAKVPEVLLLMRHKGIWIRTQVVHGGAIYLLRYSGFGLFDPEVSKSPPRDTAAACIRQQGPIIGALHVGPDYTRSDYDEDYVYRGDPGETANHAVVCMAYRYQDGELHIRVMDNFVSHGPLRWILFEAFEQFYFIEVEPLDKQQNDTGLAGNLLG